MEGGFVWGFCMESLDSPLNDLILFSWLNIHSYKLERHLLLWNWAILRIYCNLCVIYLAHYRYFLHIIINIIWINEHSGKKNKVTESQVYSSLSSYYKSILKLLNKTKTLISRNYQKLSEEEQFINYC